VVSSDTVPRAPPSPSYEWPSPGPEDRLRDRSWRIPSRRGKRHTAP
jgi:hypothetical protein